MTASTTTDENVERQIPLIDDEALEQLDEFLESDRVDAEALSLFAAHGFLVALAIAPTSTDASTWIPVLFNGEPEFDNDQQRNEILGHLEHIHTHATHAFERGLLPELPFDLVIDDELMDSSVGQWCAGFMEAVFLNESAWFGALEEQAAQLLLPFMALSCLFEEEDPELADLANSPRKATKMAQQLPELCLDLYLLYRAPADNASRGKGIQKKSSDSGKGKGHRGGNR